MRKIGIGLLVIVVLLVGAAFIAPKLINWNGYKPDIAAAVRDATGRELAIDGDIDISILPSTTFSVSDIRFANAPGMAPPEMARIARVEGEIGLLALIGGGVDIKRLVVTQPEIALAIDSEGQPNWAFQGQANAPQSQPEDQDDGESPIGDLSIGDLRIENGRVTFQDARTGQTIDAKGLQARAMLPSLSEPLMADIAATVNEKAVTLTAGVDAPKALLDGGQTPVRLKIDAPEIAVAFDGQAQQKPAPGLDGTFTLDIPSAGRLAAWLDRPLPEGQPDPGPVTARAVFEADGDVVAIREATLEGDALDAQIVGRLDVSGDAPQIALDIKSGVLDIDRYLPTPTEKPVVQTRQQPKSQKNADLLAGLSGDAFDLTPLRQGKADISIAIDGVKAAGFEVGAIRFGAKLANGLLDAQLTELQLYGGGVTGAVQANATGEALDIATNFKVAGVNAGALSAAATQGPSPVEGRVSADLNAAGAGKSPRELAENLAGKLAIDLGGLDLGAASAGAISGLKVNLDLPGVRQSPSLNGVVVYNKERVEFQAKIDPLPQALAGERFQADVSIASKPLTASYSGAILKAPVAGLDGAFKLSAPSVGRLAAWAGQPLPSGQPDPGPLAVEAVFAGAGKKVVVQKAQIRGDGLNIDAEGSWAKQGAVTAIELKARAGVIDLDRYMPKAAPAPASQPSAAQAGGGPLAGLSDAPLDLSALKAYAANVDIAFDGLKAAGQSIGESALNLKLEGGVLRANLAKLGIAGGNLKGMMSLDASGATPKYAVDLDGASLNLKAIQPELSGVASVQVKASGAGMSPRALAAGTTAEIGFNGRDLTIPGQPPRKLPSASLNANIAGVEGPLKARGEAVFEGEPVKIAIETDPIAKIAAGERFALKFDLTSAPIAASYAGAILQQPAPGLDGKLSVVTPSVGKALAWIGQPLPQGQPDPGPLSVAATLKGDGAVTRLESAAIDGKAFKARATGSLDSTGARPFIQAKIDIDQANIDAYLPPQQGQSAAKPTGSKSWSTEPFDFSALSAADGDAIINLKNVIYSGLNIESGKVEAKLDAGLLTATVTELRTASGAINLQATLDNRRATPRIAYKATAAGVNIRPILKAFAGSDRLSGRTELSVEGTARGAHQKAMISTLNGKGSLQFFDGAIHGMNVAQTLRGAGSLGLNSSSEKKTDFAEMGGTFTITDGVVQNNDFKMLAPLLRAAGIGPIDLPKRSLAYNVEAKLVNSLSGQGGKDGLTGLPIPIKIRGTFDNPKFEIDWKSVLQSAALDPSRLKDLPDGLLGKANGLGVNLGKIGGKGAGAAKPADVLKSLPGAVLGGGGSGSGSGGGGSGKTPAPPTKTPDPKPADAVKTLKGLFGK